MSKLKIIPGAPRKSLNTLNSVFSRSTNIRELNSFVSESGKINLNWDGSFIKFGPVDQKL